MAHITVSAANGGAVLRPHSVPRNQTTTGRNYANMLEADALRQIGAIAPEGQKWYLQQDLASAHTAEITKELPAKEGKA